MKWTAIVLTFALAGLGAVIVGCGDDDMPATPDTGMVGIDGGEGEGEDAGMDGGEGEGEDAGTDAGTDAGPPPEVHVRVAQLIPNVVGTRAGIRLCINFVGAPAPSLLPNEAMFPDGIPFRGVSQYINTFPPGLEYTIVAYEADALDTWNAATAGDERCPIEADTDEPTPLATGTLAAADLVSGNHYTVAFVGFKTDADGSPADLCGVPPTFEGLPCMPAQNARMAVFQDDHTAPAAGMTEIRFLQGIPDLPALDVCFDPDGPGMAPAEVIFNAVAFATVTDPAYISRTPITVGSITFHLDMPAAPDCFMMTAIGGTAVPFPAPVGTAAIPGSVATFDDGNVTTLFGSGNAGGPSPAMGGNGATFIPFHDAPDPSM